MDSEMTQTEEMTLLGRIGSGNNFESVVFLFIIVFFP